jgi:transcription initiation factor TFIIF subunit alpha
MMSVRQLKEGLRNHVARFYSKKTVDPANEKEFVRPVRLLRRDQASIGQEARTTPGDVEMDADEREKNQQAKALREAEREAQMKEVAPSAATAQRRLGPMKKKTTQVWQHDQTEADRAKSKIAYEEKLKWNLEDFEGKQNWVGSYEAALSQTYASIVMKDGRFEIVPVEKWYKFTPRQNFKALDLEQAEKHLVKRVKAEPEWLKNANEQQKLKREEDNNRKATRKLFVGAIKDEPEIGGSKEDGGLDEIDFEEDRFADDEEPDLFEGDPDELKQQEKRIKADQLQANVFDMKAEQDYDQAEALEKKEKQRQKELGKRVKKALMKRERNYIYDSDEENPYSDKVCEVFFGRGQ